MNKKCIIFLILVCIGNCLIGYGLYCFYSLGYENACKDFYKGHLKMDLIKNPDGTTEWKRVDVDHYKHHAWDDKNYFDVQLMTCPKCGSFNIMENGQRGRMIITSFVCKDCGYIWRIKNKFNSHIKLEHLVLKLKNETMWPILPKF